MNNIRSINVWDNTEDDSADLYNVVDVWEGQTGTTFIVSTRTQPGRTFFLPWSIKSKDDGVEIVDTAKGDWWDQWGVLVEGAVSVGIVIGIGLLVCICYQCKRRARENELARRR